MGNYPSQNDEFVKEFFKRTLHNLTIYLEDHQKDKIRYPYDVTQIINSFLGLIIFVQNIEISNSELEEFVEQCPPLLWVCKGNDNQPEIHNFKNYLKRLRNAISHRKVISISNEKNQIVGLEFKDGYNGGCFHLKLLITDITKLIKILEKYLLV